MPPGAAAAPRDAPPSRPKPIPSPHPPPAEAAYLAWLSSSGFNLSGCTIGVSRAARGVPRARATGARGVVATRDVPAGHVAFRVPPGKVLSVASSAFGGRIRAFGLYGWNALVAALVLEDAAGGGWRAYLDALPDELDTPLFWRVGEVGLLAGTRVAARANAVEVERAYREVMLPFYARVGVEISAEKRSLRNYARFGSIVLAYSFAHGARGAAMLPFADMLNATPTGANCRLYRAESGALEMTTTAPVPAGGELVNSYGARPNVELATRYGYVADVNPDDAVAFCAGELCDALRRTAPDAAAEARARAHVKRLARAGRLPATDPAHAPFVPREALFVVRRRECIGGFDVRCEEALEVFGGSAVAEAARRRVRDLDQGDREEARVLKGVLDEAAGRRVAMARVLRDFTRVMMARLLYQLEDE